MRYLFLMPLLFLAACAPTRDAADSKLASACQASVKATFTDPKENITVKNVSYDFQKAYDGTRLRAVTLKAAYTYGDSEPDDKTYVCTYTEEWSLFSYLPEFYNLQKGTDEFGNFSGVIMGDPGILLKINNANEKILH